MRRILVVNPFGIGDVLFSMPLVQALRKTYPDAQIGYVANERAHNVVRMSRAVDEVIMFNRDQFRRMGLHHTPLFLNKVGHFLSIIRRGRFDTMIDLSLARQYSFFGFLLGIPKIVGFDYKGRGIFLNKKIRLEAYEGMPVAEKQLELLRFFDSAPKPDPASFVWDYEIPEVFKRISTELMSQLHLSRGEPFIVVAPGGGRSWGRNALYKQWDAEGFAQVCRRLRSERGMKFVFAGDSYESELLNRTAQLAGAAGSVLISEALPAVAGIIKESRMMLCNDGGLMHLANMMGVKTVSLFGPVDENVYGPYRRNVQGEVLTASVACRPCYSRFVFPECKFERQCLSKISVESVSLAVEKVLH